MATPNAANAAVPPKTADRSRWDQSPRIRERLAAFQTMAAGDQPNTNIQSAPVRLVYAGYLYVDPQVPSSQADVTRPRHWQRRWFSLYNNGSMKYAIDSHPDTVPQDTIDLTKCREVFMADRVTKRPNSMRMLLKPDSNEGYDIFTVRADTEREIKRWMSEVQTFCNQQITPSVLSGKRNVAVDDVGTPSVHDERQLNGRMVGNGKIPIAEDDQSLLLRRGWLYYHGQTDIIGGDFQRDEMESWVMLVDHNLKFYKDRTAASGEWLSLDLTACDQAVPIDLPNIHGIQLQFSNVVYNLSAITVGIRNNWLDLMQHLCKRSSELPNSRQVAYVAPRSQQLSDEDEMKGRESDLILDELKSADEYDGVVGAPVTLDVAALAKERGRTKGSTSPKASPFRSRSSSPPVCLSPVSRLKEKSNSRRQSRGCSASPSQDIASSGTGLQRQQQQQLDQMANCLGDSKTKSECSLVSTGDCVEEMRRELDDSFCQLSETRRELLHSLHSLEGAADGNNRYGKGREPYASAMCHPVDGNHTTVIGHGSSNNNSYNSQSGVTDSPGLRVWMERRRKTALDSLNYLQSATYSKFSAQREPPSAADTGSTLPLGDRIGIIKDSMSSLPLEEAYRLIKNVYTLGYPDCLQAKLSCADDPKWMSAFQTLGRAIAFCAMLSETVEAVNSQPGVTNNIKKLNNVRTVFVFFKHLESLLANGQKVDSSVFNLEPFRLFYEQTVRECYAQGMNLMNGVPLRFHRLMVSANDAAVDVKLCDERTLLAMRICQLASDQEHVPRDLLLNLIASISDHSLVEPNVLSVQERLELGMSHLGCLRKTLLKLLTLRGAEDRAAEEAAAPLADGNAENYLQSSANAFRARLDMAKSTRLSPTVLQRYICSLYTGLVDRMPPYMDPRSICHSSCTLKVSNLMLPVSEALMESSIAHNVLHVFSQVSRGVIERNFCKQCKDGSQVQAADYGGDALQRCRQLEERLKAKESECQRLLKTLSVIRKEQTNMEKNFKDKEAQLCDAMRIMQVNYDNCILEEKEATRCALKVIKRRYEMELNKRLALCGLSTTTNVPTISMDSGDEPPAPNANKWAKLYTENGVINAELKKKVHDLLADRNVGQKALSGEQWMPSVGANDVADSGDRATEATTTLPDGNAEIGHGCERQLRGATAAIRPFSLVDQQRSFSLSALTDPNAGMLTQAAVDCGRSTHLTVEDRRRIFERNFIG